MVRVPSIFVCRHEVEQQYQGPDHFRCLSLDHGDDWRNCNAEREQLRITLCKGGNLLRGVGLMRFWQINQASTIHFLLSFELQAFYSILDTQGVP